MQAHRHYDADMLSVEEARDRILSYFAPLEPETRPLLEALGQVLTQDAHATFDIPPLDNSAMDGYAVQFDSIRGAQSEHPRELRVIGQLAAGQLPQDTVVPGTAVRIMTGAPIPPGADTVVPFEETDEVERKAAGHPTDRVAVRVQVPQGANIRPAGRDVRRGETVLPQGTVLGPAEIGVLASLGLTHASVVRRPLVTIIATGDELLQPGEALEPGKIYDSSSFSLATAVQRHDGIPRLLGIARDTLASMNEKLDQGLAGDLLLTSGGVSKGDYDMVKDVLSQRGKIAFWSVRMRPAKPLAFGTLRAPDGRRVPHLGLPGNPVSTLVAFEQFARPAILKMLGRTSWELPTITATLEDAIVNEDGRRVYARVVVTQRNGRYFARLTGPQESNVLTSMARANGLAICPEDVAELPAGAQVTVELLDWPGLGPDRPLAS